MPDAFIYDHVRTPRGRGKADGALHEVTALNLAVQALGAIKARNALDPTLVDDGCSAASIRSARRAATSRARPRHGRLRHRRRADQPVLRVGPRCGEFAAAQVMSGQHDGEAAAAESMSRVASASAAPGRWTPDRDRPTMPQGISADLIATKYGFARHRTSAVESQERAAAAWNDGRFARSVITVKDVNGPPSWPRTSTCGRYQHAVAGGAEALVRADGRDGRFRRGRDPGASRGRRHQPRTMPATRRHRRRAAAILIGAGRRRAAGLKPRAKSRRSPISARSRR
jgi:acetyl-CoA acetyltransferase